MIWLVWRRLRVPLLVVLGLLALFAATAVVGRFTWLAAARDLGFERCFTDDMDELHVVCPTLEGRDFATDYGGFMVLFLLAPALALPAVAGAVTGAALFGAETARGTHVFALSQALSRVRWWGAGLLIAGLPVAAAVALVTPLLAWSVAPFGDLYATDPLIWITFVTSGVVPVAHTVLAFCVAATAGLLRRTPIGALGLAIGLHVVVLVVTGLVRPAYLPPETASEALSAVQGPRPVPDGALNLGYVLVDAEGREFPPREVTVECGVAEPDCLEDRDVVDSAYRYQPASRFWPFQAIESGLLLALAAGALGAGMRGLRRRVH